MKILSAAILLLLSATASVQAQCGPYGQYPCYPPPGYYGPPPGYYGARRPPPPPDDKPMPCPNCGRPMIWKHVWRNGQWVRVYTCPECD